jgi:uncharacterized membrane protein
MKASPVKTGPRKWTSPSTRAAHLAGAALALAACAVATAAHGQTPPPFPPPLAGEGRVGAPTDAEILALVKTHCVRCHATEPTHEAFAKPPQGIVLETIEEIAGNAPKIMSQVVIQRAMPLGNETGMTDAERDRLAAWIEGRK